MGVKGGDVLHAEIDDKGRLVLETVDPDPVQRLPAAGADLYDGRDAVEQQRDLREDWTGRGPA